MRALLGPATDRRLNIFADTSPASMLPLHVKQTMIEANHD
jgi:hypothetical protein